MTQQKAGYPLDYTKTKNGSGHEGETAAQRAEKAVENAQEMAAKLAEQAREYGEKAQEAVKNFKPFVEKSMKEQPMQTLAVASIIGFVLGALWKK